MLEHLHAIIQIVLPLQNYVQYTIYPLFVRLYHVCSSSDLILNEYFQDSSAPIPSHLCIFNAQSQIKFDFGFHNLLSRRGILSSRLVFLTSIVGLDWKVAFLIVCKYIKDNQYQQTELDLQLCGKAKQLQCLAFTISLAELNLIKIKIIFICCKNYKKFYHKSIYQVSLHFLNS